LLHVVRCFEDQNVAHVTGTVDPKRDIEIVETELLLKDHETLSRLAKRLNQEVKGKDRSAPARLAAVEELLSRIAEGIPVRKADFDHVIADLIREVSPLTAKPCLFVANVGDSGENKHSDLVLRIAEQHGDAAVVIRGRLEAEIGEATQTEEERGSFLAEYGLTETGLDELVRTGYRLLDLITFYTFEGPEVRAWTVPAGTKAPEAGGKIHSDFSERFVLAEVMDLDELCAAGSDKPLREAGRIRRAGHDYEVEDGDVIRFVCA